MIFVLCALFKDTLNFKLLIDSLSFSETVTDRASVCFETTIPTKPVPESISKTEWPLNLPLFKMIKRLRMMFESFNVNPYGVPKKLSLYCIGKVILLEELIRI